MVSWFWASLTHLTTPNIKHCLDFVNAGNFGDCLKGRVRFMTVVTPAYAHSYKTICLAMHSPRVPNHTFRHPKLKSRYPNLPNDLYIISERGNEYHGWTIYTNGGTRVVDGETLAGWGVISRYPRGRIFVLFGPVILHRGSSRFLWCQNSQGQRPCVTKIKHALQVLGDTEGPEVDGLRAALKRAESDTKVTPIHMQVKECESFLLRSSTRSAPWWEPVSAMRRRDWLH